MKLTVVFQDFVPDVLCIAQCLRINFTDYCLLSKCNVLPTIMGAVVHGGRGSNGKRSRQPRAHGSQRAPMPR
jgi:hypothetical protein